MKKTTVGQAEITLIKRLRKEYGQYSAFDDREVIKAISVMLYQERVKKSYRSLLMERLPESIAASIIDRYGKGLLFVIKTNV